MIKSNEPLSMAESMEYLKKSEEKEAEVMAFIRKFTKLDVKKAKELRGKLKELDLIKINDYHIAKIIDIFPQDQEELNKIFIDVNLDEDETKKILETVKQFK
ncbi:MAG: hypothetical protein ABIJ14_00545 [Nanoarchaeota archaeon]|nr:hypothetical protein [Nanoarchaeota archaeon]